MPDYDDPEQSDGGGLRRQLEEALRELKQTKESLPASIQEAETRGAQTAQRRFDAKEVLGDLGYPGLASVFVEKHPEGDLKDLAPKFLTELGLQPQQKQEQEPPAPAVPPEVQEAAQAFQTPVPTVPNAAQVLERDEYLAKAKDPATADEAARAYTEGRVKGLKTNEDPRIYQMSDGAGIFKPKGQPA